MKYGVFDIEADQWIKFVVMGFFDGCEYRTFDSPKKFLRAVLVKRYNGWRFYAHFGGRYDFLFLLESLFQITSHIKIVDRVGRIILIRAETKDGVFYFCDSYALLPASLAKLGVAFNTYHQKKEYDFSKGVKLSNRLLLYLENDVLCLYEVIQKFSEMEYIDEVRYTIGSQAMNVFRRRFFDGEINQISLYHEKVFREKFYSGGRVEVYKGHGKNIHAYDINSLYPYVMLNDMPCGECIPTQRYHKSHIGFYCVDIRSTPNFYIPPYLVKDNKNIFVNGKGRYFLSSNTLNYLASVYGVRFHVMFGYYFHDRKPLCREYVEYFYRIKQTSTDPTQILLAKFFLNTLYGKFGQSRNQETLVTHTKGKHYTLSDSFSHYGLVLVESHSRSKFILPYIAAYITDLARLEHFKLMNIDPESIYYGDTDSIYTTSNKYKKFVSANIGGLKDEGTYEGIFLLPKTYALRSNRNVKIHFKGFQADRFKWSDFKRALQGKLKLHQTSERMLGFRECFNRVKGIKREENFFLKMVDMTKVSDPSKYDKRVVHTSNEFAFDTQAFDIMDVR